MHNQITTAITIGLGIWIYRGMEDTRGRKYSPTPSSFGRYTRALKAEGFTERRLGLGINCHLRTQDPRWY